MLLCILLVPRDCLAQLPVGTIAGVVRDAAGGVMRGVQVQAVSLATRQVRTTTTGVAHVEMPFGSATSQSFTLNTSMKP